MQISDRFEGLFINPFFPRPLRDDEVLPVRKHRVVAGAAAALKGEKLADKEEVGQQLEHCYMSIVVSYTLYV